jgi:hypothetical protein
MRLQPNDNHLVNTPLPCARHQSPTSGRLRVRVFLSRRARGAFLGLCVSVSDFIRAPVREQEFVVLFHVSTRDHPARREQFGVVASSFPRVVQHAYRIVRSITRPGCGIVVPFNDGRMSSPSAGM